MPMNFVIQQKRKELGLTQEQVAEYLNVSTPAVSKWEKGTTCPDISLLPSLARLLKIDLNTLFCFHEDLTRQEISYFCRDITNIARRDGMGAAFDAAAQKLHEYPHNETLLHCVTLQLDGLLTMSGLPSEEAGPFENTIVSWYRRLAESGDVQISNSANYMLVGRYIRHGEYDRAQETLDLMPDRNSLISSMADKLMLQVEIYRHQGQADRAAEDLQRALLMAVNKVQLLLYKLLDVELAAGEIQTAKCIAEKAQHMTETFDLWAYHSYVAHLQIALAEKDAAQCILILRGMLKTMLTPWDMNRSALFYRIAATTNVNDPRQMLPAILSENAKRILL